MWIEIPIVLECKLFSVKVSRPVNSGGWTVETKHYLNSRVRYGVCVGDGSKIFVSGAVCIRRRESDRCQIDFNKALLSGDLGPAPRRSIEASDPTVSESSGLRVVVVSFFEPSEDYVMRRMRCERLSQVISSSSVRIFNCFLSRVFKSRYR